MSGTPGYLLGVGDAGRLPLPEKSVNLVIGSPPYQDARTYGIAAQRDCREWVVWMLDVTAEAVRVSRGLVLWVCAGVTRDHCYWPACEGLLWEWWKAGGQCWRPAFWHRVGIPGSGGKKWLRADVEYVLCFKGEGNDFWTDNTAMGHAPKYDVGGQMSNRHKDGTRPGRSARDAVNAGGYSLPALANPGTLIHTKVGGGQLGSDLAHESEAPYPESLVEFFVRSFAPPGGLILDPFSGSGTTCAVAVKNDRRAIGLDLRRSQSELGHRRIDDGLRPRSPLDPPKPLKPLDGQGDLFASLETLP
jgi:hypothetical protein